MDVDLRYAMAAVALASEPASTRTHTRPAAGPGRLRRWFGNKFQVDQMRRKVST